MKNISINIYIYILNNCFNNTLNYSQSLGMVHPEYSHGLYHSNAEIIKINKI
jgi:hypothetical protein